MPKKEPRFTLAVDFIEFLDLCEKHEVEYVIIGGWATAVHGHQRMTKDLDIFVRASPENAIRLERSLLEFGAPRQFFKRRDFEKPGAILQLGVAPVRIDITTTVDGINFDHASKRTVRLVLGGKAYKVIGKAALIRNKQAAGRPQDLDDIKQLRRASRGKK